MLGKFKEINLSSAKWYYAIILGKNFYLPSIFVQLTYNKFVKHIPKIELGNAKLKVRTWMYPYQLFFSIFATWFNSEIVLNT